MNKKRIIKIFVFLIVFFILNFVAGWIMKGNFYNSFGRIMMHDLHTADQIDLLFMGDSHLYSSLDVHKLDKDLGVHSFSAATASQEVDGTLAILQETIAKHPEIKKVLIDVDYYNNFSGDFKNRKHLRNVYVVSDNLQDQKIRFKYLLKATSPKYYLNHILIFGKNRIAGNPKDALIMIKSLLNGDYWKYEYPVSEEQTYTGNGFIRYETHNEEFICKEDYNLAFYRDEVSKDWYEHFYKIINLCQENNIQLDFFANPELFYKVCNYVNYEQYILFMNDLLKDTGCRYYDFNLLKPEYLDLGYADYNDLEHMYASGAEKFTDFMESFLTSTDDEKNSMFYTSLQEKRDSMKDTVFGFNYELSDDGKSVKFIPVATRSDLPLTFDYYYTDESGNKTQLSAGTKETTLTYPEHASGKVEAVCYLDGNFYCTFSNDFNTLWIK